MGGDKLAAGEADLIAQARAQLARNSASREAPGAAPTQPAQARDAAERIAALMAAARAESERERQRLRKLYVWVPLAFISVIGLWALAWLWSKT